MELSRYFYVREVDEDEWLTRLDEWGVDVFVWREALDSGISPPISTLVAPRGGAADEKLPRWSEMVLLNVERFTEPVRFAPIELRRAWNQFWALRLVIVRVVAETAHEPLRPPDAGIDAIIGETEPELSEIGRELLGRIRSVGSVDVFTPSFGPDGWSTTADIASQLTMPEPDLQRALDIDRKERLRRPGRDKRWRRAGFVHETELHGVRKRSIASADERLLQLVERRAARIDREIRGEIEPEEYVENKAVTDVMRRLGWL